MQFRLVPLLAWGAIGLVALMLMVPGVPSGYQAAQATISTAALAFGAWVFWTHGQRWITAAGVYSLASAAFVGYAGLWLLDYHNGQVPAHLFVATAAGYGSHLLMYLLWMRSDKNYPQRDLERSTSSDGVWTINLGIGLTLVGVGLSQLTRFILVEAAAFVGVVLIAAGVAVKPSKVRLSLVRVSLVTLGLTLYILTIFQGYGRLTVVVLLVVVGTLLATRFPGRKLKLVALIGAPLGVVVLNSMRRAVVIAQYGSDAVASSQGAPGSMVSPLDTFARLISAGVHFDHGNGSTFWATITAFVPRDVWPNKPIGFGAELTRVLEPAQATTAHSMAGLTHGEWFFNWGWIGILAMCFVVGIFVMFLDLWYGKVMGRQLNTRGSILKVAAGALMIGGLADLVWVGSFTHMTRTGLRVAVVLFLYVVLAALREGRSTTAASAAQMS